jgi:hypothetical protein
MRIQSIMGATDVRQSEASGKFMAQLSQLLQQPQCGALRRCSLSWQAPRESTAWPRLPANPNPCAGALRK